MKNGITYGQAQNYYDRVSTGEQRTTRNLDCGNFRSAQPVGKMYPEKVSLPQNVRDAIKYSDNGRY